jgi:stage II sporulation protein E
MGTGKCAKESSKLALDLFKKFMDIGFGLEQTLKSLNNVLRGRYERECYSTLDLFVYDKKNCKFYSCKNGAGNSYVFGKENKIIKSSKLPIGIVDKTKFEMEEISVYKGDFFVMVSDGVGDDWISEFDKIKNKNPQKISEYIVGCDSVIKDDKTVFVIKIC